MFSIFWDRVSHQTGNLPIWLSWLANQLQGATCPHPPRSQITGACSHFSFYCFYMGSGNWAQVLILGSWALYRQGYFPSLWSDFHIPLRGETMRYLSLCTWLISPHILISSLIRIATNDRIWTFLQRRIFYRVCVTHFLYPTHQLMNTLVVSISWSLWWVLSKQKNADVSSTYWVHFPQIHAQQ